MLSDDFLCYKTVIKRHGVVELHIETIKTTCTRLSIKIEISFALSSLMRIIWMAKQKLQLFKHPPSLGLQLHQKLMWKHRVPFHFESCWCLPASKSESWMEFHFFILHFIILFFIFILYTQVISVCFHGKYIKSTSLLVFHSRFILIQEWWACLKKWIASWDE